ncbi:MAG: ABC transporter ATP-binding protein, partial [Candidatus Cloacimonetes bacterium]|nr:ABC transporter ATP-binding protein [Candidatus Cloacimonadota bacterium]
MARTAKLSGYEINFIDRILHSMFGNEIPLYEIENARQNYLSIRDAAHILNQQTNHADKLKIILNLIALAYHDRDKVHVLGNVEIVELVDLLLLDVNLLDQIFDLYEGKTTALDLNGIQFSSSDDSKLRNSMVWAAEKGDYKFLGKDNSARISFIMIEDLVMICSQSCEQAECPHGILSSKTGEFTPLRPGIFELLTPESILVLDGRIGEIMIHHDTLWTFYNLMLSHDEYRIKLPGGGVFSFVYRNGRLLKTDFAKKKSWRSKENELALDEAIDLQNPELSLLTMIAVKADDHAQLPEPREHYLELRNKRYLISQNQSSNSLLQFKRTGNQYLVSKTGDAVVFINRKNLKETAIFTLNQDVISTGSMHFIINRNWELIEIPIEIKKLHVEEIHHSFASGGNIALDGISFQLSHGQMMAIMGPSGSGKTTLLKVLLGEIRADKSKIMIDDLDFVANYSFFQRHIGYVPQDDLLFTNLSVYENLYYNLRLRLPQIRDKIEIKTRIENILRNVGLYDQRNLIVGDVMNKKLSGGQRRRLNIALELVSNPMIMILDEPTSGLSSKDSENITRFLAELKEQGKI